MAEPESIAQYVALDPPEVAAGNSRILRERTPLP
jgi:hypothetical protein